MKIVRFLSGGKIHTGEYVDEKTALHIEGDLFGPHQVTGRKLPIDKLLSPLVPTDILCIGLNYRKHAAESNSEIPTNPMLFIKSSNTLNNPFDPIPIPRRSSQIDYEAELAVVIGKTAKYVSRENALKHVLGYTCANDVSARDRQLCAANLSILDQNKRPRSRVLPAGSFPRARAYRRYNVSGGWQSCRRARWSDKLSLDRPRADLPDLHHRVG